MNVIFRDRLNMQIVIFIMLMFIPILTKANGNLKVTTYHLSRKYQKQINHWYYKIGDDSSYSKPELTMDGWSYLEDTKQIRYVPGIRWYRAIINLKGKPNDYDVVAVILENIVSAYEIYWDGQLIGRSGVVSNTKADEVPGHLKYIAKIKRGSTLPGQHVLTIRLSNHRTKIKWPIQGISIGYHFNYHYHHTYKGSHFLFIGGVLLIAGIFCVAMFSTGNRHRSYLLFALYCFIKLFFSLYPTIILFNDINVEHRIWLNWIMMNGQILSKFFFVFFVLFTYEIPKKKVLVAISFFALFISMWLRSLGWEYRLYFNELLPVIAALMLAFAMFKRTTGSNFAFAGLLIWRVFNYAYNIPQLKDQMLIFLTLGDIIFISCIIFSITSKVNEQEKLLQKALLRSSRLEVDLLKKNIQPHFILNTLQSILNWIRKKPDNAHKLIEALADEFKMINRISNKELIPIHQEIDLCNTHLKIMSYRMGAHYQLYSDGICEDQMVPPMIFHTLIENALTHSFKTQEDGIIRLACEKTDKNIVYQLSNHGSRLREISVKTNEEIQEGMGLKYIKARLQESFGDNWEMDYRLNAEEWIVKIMLRN